jgi:FKBP-type peptidyl-prolyl cis-trans isomerase
MSVRSLVALIVPLFVIAVALMSLVLMRGGRSPVASTAGAAGGEQAPAEKGVGYEWAKWTDADLTETESGLRYYDIKVGTGESPGPTSKVSVNYIGKLRGEDKVFDSSYDSGQPTEFALTGVIRGWIEGLQTMKVGGKRALVVPPSLGYGQGGKPPDIPPGAELVFEIELLAVK